MKVKLYAVLQQYGMNNMLLMKAMYLFVCKNNNNLTDYKNIKNGKN